MPIGHPWEIIFMKFLNTEEAARYLRRSKSSLYKLVMNKQIPHIKATGSLLFNQEEIDHWLKEYSRPAAEKQTIISNILKERKIR